MLAPASIALSSPIDSDYTTYTPEQLLPRAAVEDAISVLGQSAGVLTEYTTILTGLSQNTRFTVAHALNAGLD